MGVLGLAMDGQRTAAVAEQWDADIWKLCTPGGMVDLQTGKIQPALPSDYCTMMTSVAPGGPCLLWMDFLNTVTLGASVQVRLEISADFPEGVSDQIKRAVSENASSLSFRNKTWE